MRRAEVDPTVVVAEDVRQMSRGRGCPRLIAPQVGTYHLEGIR